MFTEGLDESAINWIKKGTGNDSRHSSVEKFGYDQVPKSPLLHSSGNYMSPKALPPLRFHSSLLGPHRISTLDDDSYSHESGYDDDDESVASAPDYGRNSEVAEEEVSESNSTYGLEKPTAHGYDEEIVGLQANRTRHTNMRAETHFGSSINRELSKANLKVEVPDSIRRFSDYGIWENSRQYRVSDSGSKPVIKAHPCSLKGTPTEHRRLYDAADLGTPSAPPVNDSEKEGNGPQVDSTKQGSASDGWTNGEHLGEMEYMSREAGYYDENEHISVESSDKHEDDNELDKRQNRSVPAETKIQTPHWPSNSMDSPPCYSTSGQNAWQTLVAYDACIRLCLNAWARGCTDAPEFLRDECLVLRSAFGLHKFLLQPRGVQQIDSGATESIDQARSLKLKKVVGKIRVEGKLSCLILLKSSTDNADKDSGSAICLHPGTGEYHDFFPESPGDALMIEVRDTKQTVQGQAAIPLSTLNEKIRWWPIYHDDHECIGKIQLFVASTITSEEDNHIKSGLVVETLAYDLLLEAAMRAQRFHSCNLRLHGPWKWLLNEFAEYYGVSDSYTQLRYLSSIMDVGTPTKDCLELVMDLLVPVVKARSERRLNRQEKSILLDCEARIEGLLANVFENYKSLDELSPMGFSDKLTPIPVSATPALAPAVQVYTLLHDILTQDAQMILQNYLQTAARKRCRKHMVETDEFLSANSENLLDPISISTAYLKMKNLCTNIRNEIHTDIKIHNHHIFPSSIDLSNIAAAVYSTELCKRLKRFLAACPPSCPQPHVNELLVATVDFERSLESWNIRSVSKQFSVQKERGEEMQLNLLELCKAEKMPWSGVLTNHSTSPFVENMYSNIKDSLIQYEVVISRWPQYSLVLENATADVERAIIKTLEKQYTDILTPLKDSIPKKLGMHVQKLARRQSTTIYSVPTQLGTFLNTVKRILEVLHCRVEDILKSWASCLPITGDRKSSFGEQMNGITVLLRTKYKNYMQAIVAKLYSNMGASRSTQLKRMLEETQDSDGEVEVRERMQMLSLQLIDSISNLHEVFTSQIFIALCRGFWDRMGQTVLKFLEGRKENRVWYKGSYYALGILDDTFASQMQRLQGNALQEKDLEPPRSVIEARSILCRDTTNGTDQSTYFYF
ncbi:hypothetical protein Ancab_010753 [Ancistrocladus abbreviatus]